MMQQPTVPIITQRTRPEHGNQTELLNAVRTELKAMQGFYNFVIDDYIEGRNRQFNDLKLVIHRNLSWAIEAQYKVNELEGAVDHEYAILPGLIKMYSTQRQYYAQSLEQASETNEEPIPNLQALNHPSEEITQVAYSTMLREFIAICNRAERQARQTEIMYNYLDETKEDLWQKLETAERNFRYFDELRSRLYAENKRIIKIAKEKERSLKKFQTALDSVDDHDQLTQTPTQHPQFLPSLQQQRGGATPRTQVPGIPGPRQDTPSVEEQQQPQSKIENLIRRFNNLHDVILHEARSVQNQNEALERSNVAGQNIPNNQVC